MAIIDPSLITQAIKPRSFVRTPEERLASQTARLQADETRRRLQTQGQLRGILAKYGGDIEKATPEILALDPDTGLKFQTAAMNSKRAVLEAQSADLEHQAKQFEFLGRLLPKDDDDETGYQTWRQTAVSLDIPNAKNLPLHYDDQAKAAVGHIRQLATPVTQQLADQRARIDEQRKQLDTAADNERQAAAQKETERHNREMEQRQHEQAMAQIANLGTDNERAASAQKETERHNREMERVGLIRANRPPAGAASGDVENVKDAVAGMKEGTIPPQLPGRASREYVAVLAEARRQGYDLANAATDWAATQKHYSTLNGSQQTRLRQNIDALPHMLDKVDELSNQWKAGRFPLLNRANLSLAKNGAFGKEAATVANQLDAQIADVTADLANVYMGGNSPTDHALSLAAKSLSSDWDQRVLHDMVELARTNVRIRRNSIVNSEAITPTNPTGQKRAGATGASKRFEIISVQ